MLHLGECLEKLAFFKKTMGMKYGITKMGIFGSVARQQNTEGSDIDIVVELENTDLKTMYELSNALESLYGCNVDIIRYRPSLRPLLKANIQREAIYV